MADTLSSTDDRTVVVCGMYRTGHHYIMQMISKNSGKNTVINEEDSYHPECLRSNFADDAMLTGHDCCLTLVDIENPSLEKVNNVMRLPHMSNAQTVLVVRHPANNFASVKYCRHISWCISDWIENMYNTIDLCNGGYTDHVIQYDRFLLDQAYKVHCLQNIGCPVTAETIQEVGTTRDGGGSSFGGEKVSPNVLELTNRSKYMTNRDLAVIKADDKVMDFCRKYFLWQNLEIQPYETYQHHINIELQTMAGDTGITCKLPLGVDPIEHISVSVEPIAPTVDVIITFDPPDVVITPSIPDRRYEEFSRSLGQHHIILRNVAAMAPTNLEQKYQGISNE